MLARNTMKKGALVQRFQRFLKPFLVVLCHYHAESKFCKQSRTLVGTSSKKSFTPLNIFGRFRERMWESIRLNHGGSWVQIQSGARIFRSSQWLPLTFHFMYICQGRSAFLRAIKEDICYKLSFLQSVQLVIQCFELKYLPATRSQRS